MTAHHTSAPWGRSRGVARLSLAAACALGLLIVAGMLWYEIVDHNLQSRADADMALVRGFEAGRDPHANTPEAIIASHESLSCQAFDASHGFYMEIRDAGIDVGKREAYKPVPVEDLSGTDAPHIRIQYYQDAHQVYVNVTFSFDRARHLSSMTIDRWYVFM